MTAHCTHLLFPCSIGLFVFTLWQHKRSFVMPTKRFVCKEIEFNLNEGENRGRAEEAPADVRNP